MALPIDPKAYGTLSIPQTRPIPARNTSVPDQGESTQRSAQAFVETLPKDVRDRLGQVNRDSDRKSSFNDTQKAEQKTDSRLVEDDVDNDVSSRQARSSQASPTYTSSGLAPSATLFQAQLSGQQYDDSEKKPSNQQRETYLGAYLNAGAQPGGRVAALEAALVREELAQKTLIVPPVLTQVNFIA